MEFLKLLDEYSRLYSQEVQCARILFFPDGSGRILRDTLGDCTHIITHFASLEQLSNWLKEQIDKKTPPSEPIEKVLSKLLEEVASLREEITRLSGETSDLKSGEWGTENSIEGIKKEVASLREEVNYLKSDEWKTENSIDDIRYDMNKIKSQLNQSESGKEHINTTLSELSSHSNAIDGRMIFCLTSIADIKNELSKIKNMGKVG
jgi:predicted  nucleic acid-binding Zn-ribbon protein